MKWMLIWCGGLALLAVVSAAPPIPARAGRVVDTAQLLSTADEARIDTALQAFERRSGAQMVVYLLPSLQGSSIYSGWTNAPIGLALLAHDGCADLFAPGTAPR